MHSSCLEKITRNGFGPPNGPNGCALSPDGTKLYVAETPTGRLWSYGVTGPGELETGSAGFPRATLVYASPGKYYFDSMAVDSEGNICVATIGSGELGKGGISVVKADGSGLHSFIETGDKMTTNIGFGGPGHQDAFITCSESGRLMTMKWHCPGHKCHFEGQVDPADVSAGAFTRSTPKGGCRARL